MNPGRGPLVLELQAVARAYAAVLFGHDARIGAALLLLTLRLPAAGGMGLLAVLSAHAASAWLGLPKEPRHAGAHGYNAALLGLLLGAGHGWSLPLVLVVALAGAATAVVTVVLAERLQPLGLPVLVLPFVASAFAVLPALPETPPAPAAWWSLPDWVPPWPADDVARGLAAVYCQDGVAVGLLVLALLVLQSRQGALAALVGSAGAMALGRLLGVGDGTALAIALVYNGAFTGLALGAALLVPGRRALLLACGGGAAAGLVAIGLHEVLPRLQLPVLSLPFALVTLFLLRSLQLRTAIRPPFLPPLPGASPEANLDYVASMARRFGPPGVPEFALPLAAPPSGDWCVSQGQDGEHTHRGPWRHALDFEVVDAHGFPFRGQGRHAADYLAFGLPVLAPAAGTVVGVVDGCDDGEVGAVDAARPWGNAIVLAHGPALFTVLAHLRSGSLLVRPGQAVARGDRLAAAGASGRSPRPHVHFQAQATPTLGAPSLPCRFVHYTVRDGELLRFVAHGTPAEGERVAAAGAVPEDGPARGLLHALVPGAECTFALADGARLRLCSEIELHGARCLFDRDRGDRLYFVVNAREVVFTTHTGNASAPLRALLRALPRLPCIDADAFVTDDVPPPAAVLPGPLRLLRALLLPFGEPFRTGAALRAVRRGDRLVVDTSCGRRGRRCWQGRVELDAHGLFRLELTAAGAPAPTATWLRLPPPGVATAPSPLPEVRP